MSAFMVTVIGPVCGQSIVTGDHFPFSIFVIFKKISLSVIPTEFKEKHWTCTYNCLHVCACPFVCLIHLSDLKWREKERGEADECRKG